MINTKIEKIAEAIASENFNLFSHSEYDQFTDQLWWAWENWDENVVKTYYEGQKPEKPTYDFRYNYVINELENVPENHENLIASFKG